jgi:hypothetical protein
MPLPRICNGGTIFNKHSQCFLTFRAFDVPFDEAKEHWFATPSLKDTDVCTKSKLDHHLWLPDEMQQHLFVIVIFVWTLQEFAEESSFFGISTQHSQSSWII